MKACFSKLNLASSSLHFFVSSLVKHLGLKVDPNALTLFRMFIFSNYGHFKSSISVSCLRYIGLLSSFLTDYFCDFVFRVLSILSTSVIRA